MIPFGVQPGAGGGAPAPVPQVKSAAGLC